MMGGGQEMKALSVAAGVSGRCWLLPQALQLHVWFPQEGWHLALDKPCFNASGRALAASHITEPSPAWEGAAPSALSDNLLSPQTPQ